VSGDLDPALRRLARLHHLRGTAVYLLVFVFFPYSVLFTAVIVLADDEDRPRTIAALGGLAVFVLVLSGGRLAGVWLAYQRGWRRWTLPAVEGADRARRKRVYRAVRSGHHLTGEDEPLAREVADRAVRGRWDGVPLVIFFLGLCGWAAVRDSAETDFLLGSATLAVLASLRVARNWWRGRQGRRYLR
jgi:hypothetical protein